MPPSSGSKQKQSKKPELCLPLAFTPVLCWGYCSALRMEAKCSSETSVDSQRDTWRHIPKDTTLITTAVKTSNPTSLMASAITFLCGLYAPTSGRIFNRLYTLFHPSRYDTTPRCSKRIFKDTLQQHSTVLEDFKMFSRNSFNTAWAIGSNGYEHTLCCCIKIVHNFI